MGIFAKFIPYAKAVDEYFDKQFNTLSYAYWVYFSENTRLKKENEELKKLVKLLRWQATQQD